MHRIISSFLKRFSEDNDYEDESESIQFEYFTNYIITYEKFPSRFDVRDITSDSVDSGIDGIVYLIDDELATTIDEVRNIFNRPKRNISVEILFIQAKTSEYFDRGEILKFIDGVEDFVATVSSLPHGPFLQEAKEIFEYIIENVAKVKNGRPDCRMFFACTSSNSISEEIGATGNSAKRKIEATGLFDKVEFKYLGLSELTSLWNNTVNTTRATLSVDQFVAYPTMGGITEAYIAIVSVKEFIDKLLLTDDGKLRVNIFEENVRFFLGLDNSVNKKIKATLEDNTQADKFAILNNGITIISPDVKVQNKLISLENYQIVNGCQTSNVLYDCRNSEIETAYVTVKIIEATDADVISNIVSATNSQSKVDDNQFLAFNPFVRRLERYFIAVKSSQPKWPELYFERRLDQYRNSEVPKKQIFSILETGRALGALFLQKPDLASRYPNKFISEMKDKLFDERNCEEAFYTAAVVNYTLKPFYQTNKQLNRYAIYKWHIITIFGYLTSHKAPPDIKKKKKVAEYCSTIMSICLSEDKMQKIVESIPNILNEIGLKDNRDEVRSATYAKQVLEYCNRTLTKVN